MTVKPNTVESALVDQDWWRGAVIYQIYPRSFQDSDGDGIREYEGMPLVVEYQTSTNAVRQSTQALIKQWWGELGIETAIDFQGFVHNPYTYMANAAVFVLSSRYEGFGNVLAEALACGCPVVSTDCPSGPAEILEDGAFGTLVPVGDDQAMADAICESLEQPADRQRLQARGDDFALDPIARRYIKTLLGS